MDRIQKAMKMSNVLMKNKYLLLLIIIVLVGNVIYWGSQKEGFHVDEMFSYEQVGNTKYPKPEYDRPDEPCINTWHNRAYYTDYLTIDSEEAFDIGGFYKSAIRNDAHPPLYLTLLGMYISAFFKDSFTKWSGISFNLIFFILTLLFIYDLSKQIFQKTKTTLAAVIMYGCCAGAVSTAIFIRDYMMLTCFSVAFLDVHAGMMIRQSDLLKKRILRYISVSMIMLLGLMTHFYFVVFAFFACLGYWLLLLLSNEKKLLLEYTFCIVSTLLIYVLIYPGVYSILYSGFRGQEAIENLTSSSSDYLVQLSHYIQTADSYIFGGVGILVLIAIITLYAIIKYKPRVLFNSNGAFEVSYSYDTTDNNKKYKINSNGIVFLYIVFVTTGCLLLITKIAPVLWLDTYKDIRYIFNLFPGFILIFVFIIDRLLIPLCSKCIIKMSVWLLCGIIILLSYASAGVGYLYKGAEAQLDLLEVFQDDKVIFVSEASYLCSNLNVYFTEAEAVYQTNLDGLPKMKSPFEEFGDEEILLYVSNDTENVYDTLSTVCNQFSTHNYQYLFDTTGRHTAAVFLVRRGDV